MWISDRNYYLNRVELKYQFPIELNHYLKHICQKNPGLFECESYCKKMHFITVGINIFLLFCK